MALDGLFLAALRKEFVHSLVGARVDKIHQPSREEVVLVMRGKQHTGKLLLRASSASPRVHFTSISLENPKSPPMFCMLLRKHLSNAKLTAIRQQECDRILFLDFQTTNELLDVVQMTLVCEIMGRHSNIMLVNEHNVILDAIKRVSEDMSRMRQILPGLRYTLPPMRQQCNPLVATRQEATEAFAALPNQDFAKAIATVYQGVSPVLAREAAHIATGGLELQKNAVSSYRMEKLFDFFERIRQSISEDNAAYTVVLEGDKPKEFTLCGIEQYGSYLTRKEFDSPSALLDFFFVERDRLERMKQRSSGLLKLVMNTNDRIVRKLALQQQELAASLERERLKQFGDLLSSNFNSFQKGDASVVLANFYDEAQAPIEIPLDIRLTPIQNAQKYYADYRKAKTAEQKLQTLMQEGKQEMVYLESIFDAIVRTSGESELLEIREELVAQGYLKNQHKKSGKAPKPLPPLSYRSSEGYTILCGRNNTQNDKLTLKTAKNYDLWLHTHEIAGSHVVVVSQGGEIPPQTIGEAAMIAAYHSKARDSAGVPVDFTLIKYVKKPNGAKPGMVIFTNQQTTYVTPRAEIVDQLKQASQRKEGTPK